MTKKIIFLMCFSLSIGSVPACLAQQGLLFFDKPFYFSGEFVFYNIQFNEVQVDTTYIKVVLSKGKNTIAEHFNKCIDAVASGYVKLSHELSSGIYTLQAFAYQAKTGRSYSLFDEAISIFGSDDVNRKQQSFAQFDPHRNLSPMPRKLETIGIDFSAENEVIHGSLNWNDATYETVSICIRKQMTEQHLMNIRPFSHNLSTADLITALPIVGSRKLKIEDQNRSPLLYVCHPASLQFQLTNVDDAGKFVFEFDEIYGREHIQFVEFLGIPMDVSMAREDLGENPVFRNAPDNLISDAHQRFEERKKVFQLFNKAPQSPSFAKIEADTTLPVADFDIDVPDYAIRGTIVDLIREVSTSLKFRKKKDRYIAKVLYEVGDFKYYFSAPPLFIINGIAIHDVEFVSNLALQEIKRIRIYSRLETLKHVIGGHRIGGIILIDLMDPLFKIPDELYLPGTTISGLQTPLHFPVTNLVGEAIPKIEPLVYWAPNVDLTSKGEVNFQFTRPDVRGSYILEALFKTEDGEIEMASHSFVID